MRRLPDFAVPLLAVIGGIAGLLGLMLFVLSIAAPQTVETLGLGTSSLQAELLGRAENLEPLYGIRPLLDGVLLIGSYAVVCVLLWLQRYVGTLIANRNHFR